MTREGLSLVWDEASSGWAFSPFLISTLVNPNSSIDAGDASGGITQYCTDDGIPNQYPLPPITGLGWMSGNSAGAGHLLDTNSSPDRLVGTTSWSPANPPDGAMVNATDFSYTASYDLTLVDLDTL